MNELAAMLAAGLSLGPAPLTHAPHNHHNVVAHVRHYTPSNKWLASWYGGGEKLASRTANGERFNKWGLTAASRTLPMGTKLEVCYRGCAVVRINDRGPHINTGRNLDLSFGAAKAIGVVRVGVARVRVTQR